MKLSVETATALATKSGPAPYVEAEPVIDRAAPAPAAPEAPSGRGAPAPTFEAAPPPAPDAEPPPPPEPPARKPLAVFVTHGMGQQLPFATLDLTARGIERALGRWTFGGRAVQDISVGARTVQLGEIRTQRLELGVQVDGAETPLDVHLYEAYWAPLTEGRVSLRDVMLFLVRGAWNGLRKGAGQPLERFMFGHNAIHGVQVGTFLGLLTTALVLGSLVLLNGVIGAVVLEAGYDVLANGRAQTGGPLASALTTIVTLYLGVTTVVGLGLGIAAKTANYDAARPSRARRALLAVIEAGLVGWVGATLLTGMLTLSVLLWKAVGRQAAMTLPATPIAIGAGLLAIGAVGAGVLSRRHGRRLQAGYRAARERGEPYDGRPLTGWREQALSVTLTAAVVAVVGAIVVGLTVERLPEALAAGSIGAIDAQWFRLGVWFALFGVSALIRNVIVQYFGDVAAYVSSHTLDRFAELRRAIREVTTTLLHGVYHSRDADGEPAYAGVAIVGHSLGSVVAYDALNRALTLDEAAEEPVDVLGRTRLLLTFGSPLDKTAYIFRAQNQSLSPVREALANAVQPLIQDVRYRAFPWVNVHSSRDVIGSALDLYDAPVAKSRQRAAHDADHHAGGHDIDPDRLRAEIARLHASVQPAGCPYCVYDVEDPAARVPLAAHNEHWETRAVWDVLVAAALAPALDAVAEPVVVT
ncbi:hypothetical protein [Rubrivirga sp. IMCC43871]|uniref:hypothetical protein n=1 Tax=Rubrivirga sp. IMCC43871 TaxID=3391575 RepID=UPI00398FCAEB